MRNHKENTVSIGIGMSTFMMIFVVLCLTIFATLTYLQARHNLQETDKIIDANVAYYNADYKATEIYEQLISHLEDDSFFKENGITKQDHTYHYSVSITETRTLEVTVCKNQDKLKGIQWQETAAMQGNYEKQGFVN